MVAILQNIVIAGGGIIGNSIAYYLAKRNCPTPVTLVDPVGIAPCASGKAGGFLARTWRDGTPLQELQRLGFDLHAELAEELMTEDGDDDDMGYRRLTCAAVSIDEGRAVGKPPSRKVRDVEWVDRGVVGSVSMGDEETIAQVHPRKLCEAMWKFSERKGFRFEKGRITKAITDEHETNGQSIIEGVQLEDGTILKADTLVVACGPWTEEAMRSWFPTTTNPKLSPPLPRITGIKCHSILVPSPRILNQAVFYESDGALGDGDLEVYPRPDGDAYINGFQGEEGPVTERPGEERVEPEAIEKLEMAMERTTSIFETEDGERLEPHTKQVCYWPETEDGLPYIGSIPFVEGAFVAAGHGVWGILQGPATGKAMAEVLLDGECTCLDLERFRIDR